MALHLGNKKNVGDCILYRLIIKALHVSYHTISMFSSEYDLKTFTSRSCHQTFFHGHLNKQRYFKETVSWDFQLLEFNQTTAPIKAPDSCSKIFSNVVVNLPRYNQICVVLRYAEECWTFYCIEFVCRSRAMQHSAGSWSLAMPHRAGSNCIELDQLVKLWTHAVCLKQTIY
jgi:hypothetical protein